MLRMSAKAVFDDHLAANELLITEAATNLPRMFTVQFRKNVIPFTPKKTGALRRSIVTQAIGHTAKIAWRLPYAVDQNLGVDQTTGRAYKRWTTPGTGPGFKDKALALTIRQLDPMFREVGLTK
jgi:hypothetical protein